MAWEGIYDNQRDKPPVVKAPSIPLEAVHPFMGEREAILAGIGPGLDDFMESSWDVGKRLPVLAINEAVCIVPACRAGIVFDHAPLFNISRWTEFHADDAPRMILESTLLTSERSWVHPCLLHDALTYTRKDCVSALARPGTGTIALHILADAGVTDVTLVGMDSYWEPESDGPPSEHVRDLWRELRYAPKYGPAPKRYAAISAQMKVAVAARGINVKKWAEK